MVWEFPAVSQTRIEFWRKPQFTQSGMWWFTLFLGFFGVHHLYLRSPQTAVLFFILNFLTMGYLWAYDLVQLSSMGEFSGPNGLEALNKHGLSYAFGPLGLAQGMWKEPESLLPNGLLAQRGGGIGESELKEEERQYGPPPEPIYFLLYFLTVLISPLAKAIAGDYNNSFSSVMNLIFVPLGFYFYIVGLVYDIIILMAYPAHLCVEGAKRGIPFTWMGFDPKGHSPNITGKSEIDPCPPQESFITAIMRWIIPIMKFFPPTMFHGTMLEKLLVRWNDGKEALDKREKILSEGGGGVLGSAMSALSAFQRGNIKGALHSAGDVAKIVPGGGAIAKLAESAEGVVGKGQDALKAAASGNIKGALHSAADAAKIVPGGGAIAKLAESAEGVVGKGQDALQGAQAQAASAKKLLQNPLAGSPYGIPLNKTHGTSVRRPLDSQSGGAINTPEPTFSLLDYTALGSIGAVIAGGLLLSANRFRNVFTKGDDSPPKPRTV